MMNGEPEEMELAEEDLLPVVNHEVIGKYNPALVDAGLLRPLDELHEDPNNVREHNERSIAEITNSLARFGQQKPVVVDATGMLVAGNGTLRAALGLGWTHLATLTTDQVGAAARAYALADNRVAEHATWLYEGLAAALKLLQEAGEPIEGLGWADYELEPLMQATWAPPAEGEMPSAGTTHVHVAFTAEQWLTVSRAIAKAKGDQKDMGNGRALELICGDFLA